VNVPSEQGGWTRGHSRRGDQRSGQCGRQPCADRVLLCLLPREDRGGESGSDLSCLGWGVSLYRGKREKLTIFIVVTHFALFEGRSRWINGCFGDTKLLLV